MRHIGRLMGDKIIMKITHKCVLLINILSAIYIICCSSTVQSKGLDNKVNPENFVGWLHGNCFAVKDAHIPSGTLLTVVELDNKQQITHAKIMKEASNGDECNALREERSPINFKEGIHFYTVSSKKPIELGIGVINSDKANTRSEKKLLDLNRDGQKDTFYSCSTAEGIQFSIWSKIAYKSSLIWSDYYYLGYDTEANCPPLPN